MQYLVLTLVVLTVIVVSSVDAGSCPGICQPNTYACSGSYRSGLCPGGTNIECCPESTPNCNGQCQINSLACSTGYQVGKCPGGNNIECCPSGGSSGSGKHGVDVSQLLSTSSWSCLKGKGYSFGIPRIYQSTGNPDPNGPQNVANAHSAGISPGK